MLVTLSRPKIIFFLGTETKNHPKIFPVSKKKSVLKFTFTKGVLKSFYQAFLAEF